MQKPFIMLAFWAVSWPAGVWVGVLGSPGAPRALHSTVRAYINGFTITWAICPHFRTQTSRNPYKTLLKQTISYYRR